ncbi:MAG: NAD(P)H-hydrate dehydratase [Chloroflexi bacterium]|nr:NAD(P)H-hydrate dehydratase [Chloroflexota bacterium]
MKIVTADQMRDLERQAAEIGITPDILMENAGSAVANEMRRILGVVIDRRILILVGPGNNGGDGLVAARRLHNWGAAVTIYLCRTVPDIPERVAANVHRASEPDRHLRTTMEMGIPVVQASADPAQATLCGLLSSADVALDALLGTGKARPLEGDLANVAQRLARAKARRPQLSVIAVDLPTGLNPDTGATDPHCVTADFTLTLGYPKIGLLTFPGASRVGEMRVLDIGIPGSLGQNITLDLMTPEWVAAALPRRPLEANKGTFGRVLVIAGSINYVGAAALSCAAATRTGAGLVTLATPASLVPVAASKLTEVTYLPLPEASPGVLSTSVSVSDMGQAFTVCLIGCGLGQSPGAEGLVRQALCSDAVKPECRVVDADALNILSRIPRWWEKAPGNIVLTPHPGEMARLTGLTVDEVEANRVRVARESAQKWGKVVALKGAYTVVANPDGRAMVSPFANPGLASAGTGDVLAGAIAGLAAQGQPAYEAAVCGVYLHGAAGELARDEFGDAGILATDLLPALPRVIRDLKSSYGY